MPAKNNKNTHAKKRIISKASKNYFVFFCIRQGNRTLISNITTGCNVNIEVTLHSLSKNLNDIRDRINKKINVCYIHYRSFLQ